MITVKTYRSGVVGVTIRKPGSKFHGIFKVFASMKAAQRYIEGMQHALDVHVKSH